MLRRSLPLKYFNKVLIANRGEIACRVIQTCNRLNIPTVAIYSEADAKSKHVALADEAFCVGPAASRDSYLRIDRIMDVIQKAGVDGVHPGYGFLSENSEFSRALASAGVTFIGPTERAIQAMGDKIESKKLAKSAGVQTIPGFDGEIENVEHLLQVANDIGYPIMMKASAGGGGKGMRVAFNDEDAKQGFKLAKEEAAASFGDDRMLVEKFVNEPRHIEIQVIGDKHGNTLYLPERECSVQRRNQKVIEEAPSTFITPEIRKAMGEQAVSLAKAVDYHTAGTVEMMVDKDRNFYFLEMNTRLQVEHPITEMIVGLDLVEEMMRAASGTTLSVRQEDIKINGWATECRVYAEDPLNNFLPVVGRMSRYSEPTNVAGVRCDSGILEGSEISLHYDPMIAKLCTWAPNRDECISRMLTALDSYVMRGLERNNVNFLRNTLLHPRYQSGGYTTKFIEEEFKDGYFGHELTADEAVQLSTLSVFMHNKIDANQWPNSVSKNSKGPFVVRLPKFNAGDAETDDLKFNYYAVNPTSETTVEGITRLEAQVKSISFAEAQNANNLTFEDDCQRVSLSTSWQSHEDVIQYKYGCGNAVEESIAQRFKSNGNEYTVQFLGTKFQTKVFTPAQATLSQYMKPPPKVDLTKQINSPMPGSVVEIHVAVGDQVNIGDAIVTLEAMKMRNALNAAGNGVVKAIHVKEGQSVEGNEVLVEFE